VERPLGEFLDAHRFGTAFREWYFMPMMGCIWSSSTARMLAFPVATMIRFCHNHGPQQAAAAALGAAGRRFAESGPGDRA